MKILLLCGTLEAGRDGAGDQARRLSGELMNIGHKVMAVGIFDKYVVTSTEEKQNADGKVLNVLRIPSKWNSRKRYLVAEPFINKFDPEWISLQFVNFGFQKKGLPIDLITKLPKIIRNRKFHIMFQELWCGVAIDSDYKEKVLGFLQFVLIGGMVKVLKPSKVFTNNRVYQKRLKLIGVKASLAPVFSNIPLKVNDNDGEWTDTILRSSLDTLIKSQNDFLVLGFFGTVYPCPGLRDVLVNASIAAKQLNMKLGVISIGHGRGLDVSKIVNDIPEISYWNTGELSLPMVDKVMELVDLAVMTTASNVVNKSSVAGAWLERGIPNLIASSDDTFKDSKMEQGFFQIRNPDDILVAKKSKKKFTITDRLKNVAESYSNLNFPEYTTQE